ncbi:MAG: fructokinase [Baekduia sp.]|jgi:sugar/nucleoside kinase (ribokinase family)|nr:fructokinase [Baekduia sp.]
MSNQDHTLVAGEALSDLWLDADGEVRGRPGGGPFNTARTPGRLGRRVTHLGVLVASMTCERVGASPPTLNEVQARQRNSAAGSAVASAKSASESMPPRSAR